MIKCSNIPYVWLPSAYIVHKKKHLNEPAQGYTLREILKASINTPFVVGGQWTQLFAASTHYSA